MTPCSSTVFPVRIPFTVLSPSGPVPRYVFSFIIATRTSLVLIDAGVSGSEQLIFGTIRDSSRKTEEIGLLVLTHSHPDHIGGARIICEKTGCRVAAHRAEQKWIEDTQCQERERPVPGFSRLVGGSVGVDHLLEDGESIRLGEGQSLEVIHTPGHSPGSIALLLRPEMALFSGDAIPVPGNIPIYDDPQATIQSLRRLMKIDHINYLFSSWDAPKVGEEVYHALDEGYSWVEKVSVAVRDNMTAHPGIEPDRLTSLVLREIGLPPESANPLVTRTIMAHAQTL